MFVVSMFVSGCSSSSSVLAKVNGETISESDLEFLGEINPRIQSQLHDPAGKKSILDNLVEQKLLYQEAVRRGLNRDKDVEAKADLYRRVIVAQALIDAQVEENVKKYYEEHQDEFKKLELAHIMIAYGSPEEIKKAKKEKKKSPIPLRSEQEALTLANAVKARLDKGENFSEVAKETSEDLSTKNANGNLGKASKDERRLTARGFAPLLEKAFTMNVGEISGPIKTAKGYHIITVTAPVELEPLATVQEAISFKLRNDTRTNLLAELKKEAKIVYPQEEKEKQAAPPEATKPELPVTPEATPSAPASDAAKK